MIREDVYSGVFAFFQTLQEQDAPIFNLATRKATTWENAAPEDQPALLMRQRTEAAQYRKGLPTTWRFNVDLFLYVHTGAQNDPDIIPSQILNPLLDAIESSLAIDDPFNNSCTLGGLVSHCAISGTVEIFEGNLGDEATVIVPIEILVIA